ncbi:MAG: hypothetical protein ACPLPR_05550 [Bacillota bacterium]
MKLDKTRVNAAYCLLLKRKCVLAGIIGSNAKVRLAPFYHSREGYKLDSCRPGELFEGGTTKNAGASQAMSRNWVTKLDRVATVEQTQPQGCRLRIVRAA